MDGIGVGKHAGEAFAGGGEVELGDGLDGVGAFAVVAGVEHGEDLLGAVGDVECAHGFDGVGADTRVLVAGGGFEEILKARVFEPANEAYGDGGDAGVGVAAEGDDLAAVGVEVVECGEHFEALGDFVREGTGEFGAEVFGEPRVLVVGRTGGGVLDDGGKLGIVGPGFFETELGAGDVEGLECGGHAAEGEMGRLGERGGGEVAPFGAAFVGEIASGGAGDAFVGIGGEGADEFCGIGEGDFKEGTGEVEFPRNSVRGGSGRHGLEHAGVDAEALGGIEADGVDEAHPLGPVGESPGEILADGGDALEVLDGARGLAEQGVEEAEGVFGEGFADGAIGGGNAGHGGRAKWGGECEEEGIAKGGVGGCAEQGGGRAGDFLVGVLEGIPDFAGRLTFVDESGEKGGLLAVCLVLADGEVEGPENLVIDGGFIGGIEVVVGELIADGVEECFSGEVANVGAVVHEGFGEEVDEFAIGDAADDGDHVLAGGAFGFVAAFGERAEEIARAGDDLELDRI